MYYRNEDVLHPAPHCLFLHIVHVWLYIVNVHVHKNVIPCRVVLSTPSICHSSTACYAVALHFVYVCVWFMYLKGDLLWVLFFVFLLQCLCMFLHVEDL